MLSASEIADLEKKVNTYRLKSQLRYVFFIVLFVIVASILFFFYSNKITIFNINLFSETSKKNTTETVSIALNKEENASFSSPPISSQTKEEIPIAPVIVTQPAVAQTLLLKSPKANTGKESKNNSSPLETPSIEPVKQDFSQKEPIRPPAEVLLPPSSREDLFYRSSEENIDTTVLAPPHLDEIKPKGVIKIESKEVNSIEYLKNKFEKTNNIIFALMLAEEYYVNKNYAESNKWALIANHIDAENEKSWLWFAKSKVKLGQKEDAIVALKAFLKTNKSQAAQTLLNKINLGELNE